METIFDHNPTEEELEMVPRVVCKDKKTYLQCVTDEDAVLRDLLALFVRRKDEKNAARIRRRFVEKYGAEKARFLLSRQSCLRFTIEG